LGMFFKEKEQLHIGDFFHLPSLLKTSLTGG
jgi:hypothetical protein